MAGREVAEVNEQKCPKCGSLMWDNRPKKATGEFSPKSPDFKCRNEKCAHVIWPPKNGDIPVTETPPVVPAVEQKQKELIEIANVIKSNSMYVCNAMNNACALYAAGKITGDQLEATYKKILMILEK